MSKSYTQIKDTARSHGWNVSAVSEGKTRGLIIQRADNFVLVRTNAKGAVLVATRGQADHRIEIPQPRVDNILAELRAAHR